MRNVQKFSNELFQLEVKAENGESLFNVETVARSLGITKTETKNGKKYTSIRWERVKNYLPPQVGESIERGSFISEPMVYKLAFKANNPLAEKFQDWLAVEVLPSIRKNGAYATPETIESIIANPDFGIQLLSNLKEEKEKNLLLEQQVAEYEPKISYLDSILESTDTVAITQIAADYGLSAMAMNKKLHELKVQHKVSGQWILYTKHQREGYTKSHTVKVPKADGTEKVVMNTKWTQKGRLFIYELLKDNGIYPLMDIEQLQLA